MRQQALTTQPEPVTREEQGKALLWRVFQAPACEQGEAMMRVIDAAVKAAQEKKP